MLSKPLQFFFGCIQNHQTATLNIGQVSEIFGYLMELIIPSGIDLFAEMTIFCDFGTTHTKAVYVVVCAVEGKWKWRTTT